jgi:hypothetical protein
LQLYSSGPVGCLGFRSFVSLPHQSQTFVVSPGVGVDLKDCSSQCLLELLQCFSVASTTVMASDSKSADVASMFGLLMVPVCETVRSRGIRRTTPLLSLRWLSRS